MFCIWSRTKFNRIDVLKLFCLWLHFLKSINSLLLVCRSLGSEMIQGLYISLWTFQSIFLSLCRCRCCCCCCFRFCVSQEGYGGAWHWATNAFVEKHSEVKVLGKVLIFYYFLFLFFIFIFYCLLLLLLLLFKVTRLNKLHVSTQITKITITKYSGMATPILQCTLLIYIRCYLH